jgi:hypothetical protein
MMHSGPNSHPGLHQRSCLSGSAVCPGPCSARRLASPRAPAGGSRHALSAAASSAQPSAPRHIQPHLQRAVDSDAHRICQGQALLWQLHSSMRPGTAGSQQLKPGLYSSCLPAEIARLRAAHTGSAAAGPCRGAKRPRRQCSGTDSSGSPCLTHPLTLCDALEAAACVPPSRSPPSLTRRSSSYLASEIASSRSASRAACSCTCSRGVRCSTCSAVRQAGASWAAAAWGHCMRAGPT